MESLGAICYVLDPFKFKIIRDSWNKTDKQDARNMAKALWVYKVTGPAELREGEPLDLLGIQRLGLGHGEAGSWPMDLDLLNGDELRVQNGVVERVQ